MEKKGVSVIQSFRAICVGSFVGIVGERDLTFPLLF